MKFKHSISLLLAIVLVLGLAIPVCAEDADPTIAVGTYSELTVTSPEIPVTLETKEVFREDIDNVLGVEITWNVSTLKFTKEITFGAKWNPATLKYEKYYEDENGSLGEYCRVPYESATLCKVTNRSLVALDVIATFTPHDVLTDVAFPPRMTFSYSGDLDAAVAKNMPEFDDTDIVDEEGVIGGTTTISMQMESSNSSAQSTWFEIIEENNLTSLGSVTLSFSRKSV